MVTNLLCYRLNENLMPDEHAFILEIMHAYFTHALLREYPQIKTPECYFKGQSSNLVGELINQH